MKAIFEKRWQYFYFVFAFCDLLAICIMLYMSHIHLNEYSHIVNSNVKTMSILKATGNLLEYAQKSNAPGNNIFESLDVEKEKREFLVATREFDRQLLSFYEHIYSPLDRQSSDEMNNKDEKLLIRKLIDEVQVKMLAMKDATWNIFFQVEKKKLKMAGSLMADMDRKYGDLIHSIEKIRKIHEEKQNIVLKLHQKKLIESNQEELAYSLFVLVAIILFAIYGTKMSNYIQQNSIQHSLLASIVSSSNDAIFSKNLQGIISSWNGGAESIFGFSAKEMIGQSMVKTIPEHLQFEELLILNKMKSGENISDWRTQRVTKALKLIDVSITVSPIKNDSGEVVGVAGVIRDITLQKEKENKIQKITDTMHDGLVIQNSEGKIIQFNPAALRILGLTEDQILGRTSLDERWRSIKEDGSPFSGEDHPAMIALKTGKSISNVIMGIVLPNEDLRWIRINAVPMETNEGRNAIATFSDVTEQMQAHSDIQKIFSHSLDLMCIINFDGTYKRLSPSFERLLEFSLDDLILQPFLNCFHPEDHHAIVKALDELRMGRNLVGLETRILTKNQGYKLISWVCEPDGKTGLIYATGRDVTEIRATELKNQEILNAIDQTAIVAYTDKFGKIIHVNDNFCKISGYEREELLGKTHKIINSGAHPKKYFQEMWNSILHGKKWVGDIENKSKSGDHYHVRSVIVPIKNIQDEIDQIMSIRFDITEQKTLEKQFLEAQSVAKIGNWSFHLITGKIYWSDVLYTLHPVNKEDGPPSYEQLISMIHEEDRELFITSVKNCIENKTPYKVLFRVLFPDRIVWVEGHGRAKTNIDGQVIELLGTAQDKTSDVEMEKNLQMERSKSLHNAKLASLGEMSAGIAHEINNPLAIIAGNLPFLVKFRLDENRFQHKIHTLEKAVIRIEKIVKGLKKFSCQTDRTPYKIQSIKEIVSESLMITEAKSRRHFTPVSLEISEDLSIYCNEVEVEQVLVNLINNGIDAVKSDIDRWIKIKAFRDGLDVVLQVMDSGTGLTLEIEQKIFQPFFTTKPVGEGTGLGLSITKGILDQHKATISINRNFPNTCFEIRFQNPSILTLPENKNVA